MTAEPLDWISWWDARWLIPKIWDFWSYAHDAAKQAMVDALRSGEVRYRGRAVERDDFTSIRIEDVIPTLRELTVFSHDEVWVEYEVKTTNFHISDFGREFGFSSVLRPTTLKSRQTARIMHPELVRPEFRDYLIHFKLPAGVKPADDSKPSAVPPRQKRPTRRRGAKRRSGPMPTADKIREAGTALIKEGNVPVETVMWEGFRELLCDRIGVKPGTRGYSLDTIQEALRPLLKKGT